MEFLRISTPPRVATGEIDTPYIKNSEELRGLYKGGGLLKEIQNTIRTELPPYRGASISPVVT